MHGQAPRALFKALRADSEGAAIAAGRSENKGTPQRLLAAAVLFLRLRRLQGEAVGESGAGGGLGHALGELHEDLLNVVPRARRGLEVHQLARREPSDETRMLRRGRLLLAGRKRLTWFCVAKMSASALVCWRFSSSGLSCLLPTSTTWREAMEQAAATVTRVACHSLCIRIYSAICRALAPMLAADAWCTADNAPGPPALRASLAACTTRARS